MSVSAVNNDSGVKMVHGINMYMVVYQVSNVKEDEVSQSIR